MNYFYSGLVHEYPSILSFTSLKSLQQKNFCTHNSVEVRVAEIHISLNDFVLPIQVLRFVLIPLVGGVIPFAGRLDVEMGYSVRDMETTNRKH